MSLQQTDRPGFIARLIRLIHTIRYLKPRQLFYFVKRRRFPAARVSISCEQVSTERWDIDEPLAVHSLATEANVFTFLNIERDFGAHIDWQCAKLPRLWGYNLHYFDFLRQPDIDPDTKRAWLISWVEANPQGTQPAWEPFTTSLRIVNWVFFFARYPDYVDDQLKQSLYLQSLWLERNDERHILANHYFENLKALLFAGVFFAGQDALRWRRRASTELKAQIAEQTLADGGHYERSPQYHALMLENSLDLYNLALACPDRVDKDFTQTFLRSCERGLRWLEAVVFPDQNIPLFNDSAFGVSPTIAELQIYAKRLFDYRPQDSGIPRLISLAESGLYGVCTQQDMVVMDCGDVGPDYQPGHTHCDFLSYELMLSGNRVVVDTGVCEYEPGPRRHALRETRSHNTVCVNGLDQSEVWGEFRVARRAKKVAAAVYGAPGTDSNITLEGSFEGFFTGGWGSKPLFRHERQMDVKLDKACIKAVQIVDTIAALSGSAADIFSLESCIHIHPDFEPVLADATLSSDAPDGTTRVLLQRGDTPIACVYADADLRVEIRDAIYCPEFGKVLMNKKLVLSPTDLKPGSSSVVLGYRIESFGQ